ncbi:hypothetical protein [Streptomyces sp. NPDC002463]|uniref:hypothetical protein n=1 Tax=Streptomyces sp. NPDC002463 TaxID=3364645 RepID=UPI003690C984
MGPDRLVLDRGGPLSPLARKVATAASALAPAASGPLLSSSAAVHVKAEHDADGWFRTSCRGGGGYGDDRYQTTEGAPHP